MQRAQPFAGSVSKHLHLQEESAEGTALCRECEGVPRLLFFSGPQARKEMYEWMLVYLSIGLIKQMFYNTHMDMFVALADPTRRNILELLANSGELPATAIYQNFPMRPQAVSQHLKVLREANLVEMEKRAQQYAFHGVYHDISAPERVIDTFEFEGLPEPGHVTLETMKLEELPGGRTRLTTQSVFQSVADRDGALQSGMQEGINDTYNRLDELLKKL